MVEENANSESDNELDAYLAKKFGPSEDHYAAETEVSLLFL